MAQTRDPVVRRQASHRRIGASAGITRRTASVSLIGGLSACAAAGGIAAGHPGTVLPLETDAAGRLILTLAVPPHGRHRFVIDTGAAVSAIYAGRPLADLVTRDGTARRIWGLGGAATVPAVTVPRQRAGDLVLPPRRGVLLPAPRATEGVDGLIGMDVFADRTLTVDRRARLLAVGAPGTPPPRKRGWHSIPIDTLSVLPGGAALRFARIDFGDRSFPALIDLGSDTTYCSWTVAEASPGLRRVRRRLYRAMRVEGAVASFRPKVTVELTGLGMGPHTFGPTEVAILEVPPDELLGAADEPVIIAGMNLFADRDIVFDAPRGRLLVRPTDGPKNRARRTGPSRIFERSSETR